MHKIFAIYKKLLFVCLLLIFPFKSLFGQVISVNPLNFTSGACAGDLIPCAQNAPPSCVPGVDNQFEVTFSLFGNFPSGSTFQVVLSDVNGSFANSIPAIAPSVAIPPGPGVSTNTIGQSMDLSQTLKRIRFGLPSNPPLPGGNNYRLQVQLVQDPSVYGNSPTIGFPAAYRIFNRTFYINGGVEIVNICGTGSKIILKIDDNTIANPSPLAHPSLKYLWYKDNYKIAGQTGFSLEVSAAGKYECQIDYGKCSNRVDGSTSTPKATSNAVNVFVSNNTNQAFQILPANPAPICSGASVDLSTTPGYSYVWYRNGEPLNVNDYKYTATQSGNYKVYTTTPNGQCSGDSNTVTVTIEDITPSLNVNFSYTLNQPNTNFILPGVSISVTATTDATGPVNYEWFQGTTSLQSGPSNTYTVTTPGDYKVIVKGDKGNCTGIIKQLFFKVKEGVDVKNIPNLISPNNDGINDTWMLPIAFINSPTTEVKIISAMGEVVLSTNNYQNDWPSSPIEVTAVNPVYYYTISKDGQIVKGTITIVK
jgi:gliding motility-associated-like protein